MTFVSRQRVRFAHVDAAGIVFYPRYFEMLNAAVEEYFGAVVGMDFADIHLVRRLGVPTVRLEADFAGPSHLGDLLDFALEATAVLVMVPAAAGITANVREAVAPLARSPTVQVTTPDPFVDAEPVAVVAETYVTPAGSVSATLTEVAVAGPLLVSRSV